MRIGWYWVIVAVLLLIAKCALGQEAQMQQSPIVVGEVTKPAYILFCDTLEQAAEIAHAGAKSYQEGFDAYAQYRFAANDDGESICDSGRARFMVIQSFGSKLLYNKDSSRSRVTIIELVFPGVPQHFFGFTPYEVVEGRKT